MKLFLARDGPDDADEARRMGEKALLCDPWCERAHHVVVAGHRVAGHHRAARGALLRYDQVLVELGIDPAARDDRIEPLTRSIAVAGGSRPPLNR